MIPNTTKKNIVWDASVFSTVMSCMRLTDLRFNLDLIPIEGKSNSLECGSLVHKILETFYRCKSQRMKRDDSIAHAFVMGELYIKGCQFCTDFTPSHGNATNIPGEALFHEGEHHCDDTCVLKPKCGHQPNEFTGMRNTPPDNTTKPNRVGWKWVLETMVQYFEFYANDSWEPLEIEVVKREVLYEDDEIRILWKAKLDLTVDTNQGIYPVDHKTMKQNRDLLSLNNQFIGQCILMKTRNIIINKIGFQTSLEPKDKFIRTTVSYSADRLIEWQSEILPYWAYQYLQSVESGIYPPNFTHCENKYGFCSFKKVCESDRSMREEELKKSFKVGETWDVQNVED